MIKALVKNGVVVPCDPLPADWKEGTELQVEKTPSQNGSTAADELDKWFSELEAACAQMDPENDRIIKQAVLEVRRQEKERACRAAGLDG